MGDDYQDMSLFDFIVLCVKKLKAFFVWCFRTLCYFVRIGIKYWYVVVLFAILGVVYARFVIKPKPTTIKGEATIVFPANMKPTIESGLQLFANEDAKGKGLSEEQASSMVEIKYYNIIDARGDGSVDFTDKKSTVTAIDSIQYVMMDRLAVELTLTDIRYFAAFQDAMRKYFNGKKEYSEPAKRWRESVKRKIAFVNQGAMSTDSASLALFDIGETLREELASTPDVINFQTAFVTSAVPTSGNKMKYIYSVLVAIFIGILLSIMVEHRNAIRKYLLNNK
ncbi:MAG: hypothetical protein MJ002_00940 [Paludibacteraceae bacterium]|nr:hypothetical protein [Paludibacteraceae bacterium]